MSVLYRNTAFVSKNGNDSTAQLQNPALPYLTIAGAINAISILPPAPSPQPQFINFAATQGNQWEIQVNEGVYAESPTLPAWINLTGTNLAVIVLGLTMNGMSFVQFLIVNATNKPALVLNAPGATGIFENVVLISNYTVASAVPVMAVNIIAGVLAMTDSQITGNFNATAPVAYGIFSADTVQNLVTPLNINVNAAIPAVTVYKNTNGQIHTQAGLSTVTIAAPVTQLLMFDLTNVPFVTVLANRFELFNTSTIGMIALVQAAGLTSFYMSGNYIYFAQTPLSTQLSAIGIAIGPNLPDVELIGVGWAGNPAPATSGVFSRLAIGINDGVGSLTVNGGINASIRQIGGNYTIVPGDYSLLVTVPRSVISLPNTAVSPFYPHNSTAPVINMPGQQINQSIGQVVQIKNVSGAKITVVTGSVDGTVILKPLEALIVQAFGPAWYIFANYVRKHNNNHKKDHKRKDKKKCDCDCDCECDSD